MNTIRPMTRLELNIAVDWAAAEGWNPGLHDADTFYATDTQGFLIGLRDGHPLACISVVTYGSTFAFLGFYIVKPEERGKGYGQRIWRAGLDRLAGRTIGLDGVVAQQPSYIQSGFTLAYRNIRFQGTGLGPTLNDPDIVPLATLDLDTVIDFDRSFFPADRATFTAAWICQRESLALGLIDDGRLAGYGVMRPCRSGFKIGPLFADKPTYAERLFIALASHAAPDTPVFLDIPEVNSEALALVERHVMTPCFETARMYRGPAPTLPLNRLYGVTTFELG